MCITKNEISQLWKLAWGFFYRRTNRKTFNYSKHIYQTETFQNVQIKPFLFRIISFVISVPWFYISASLAYLRRSVRASQFKACLSGTNPLMNHSCPFSAWLLTSTGFGILYCIRQNETFQIRYLLLTYFLKFNFNPSFQGKENT